MYEGVNQVMVKLNPHYHAELLKMVLRRSADLGRRVSMGYVIQEMIEERLQTENPNQRSSEMFGSKD